MINLWMLIAAGGNFFLSIFLIPQLIDVLRKTKKINLVTGYCTGGALVIMGVSYMFLELPLVSATVFITGIVWLVMSIRSTV